MTTEPIDPYALGYSGAPTPAPVRAARRYLESGKWRSGAGLLLEMGRAIEDGVAYRHTLNARGDTSALTKEEMIARGRHNLSRLLMRPSLDRKFWVTDPPSLTKAHWRGEQPWRIRDLYPGAVGTTTAAAMLGISERVLVKWIREGNVPVPPRNGERAPYIITAPIMTVLRRMRPHWNGRRWDVEPRGLWNDEAAGHACPHCGEPLIIEVSVGVPHTEPATDEEDPPVSSEPADELSDDV